MRTARAALTSVLTEVVGRIEMLLLALATARLLDPLDLGTLGLAVIVVGLVAMLGAFPEAAAILASQPMSDHRRAQAGLTLRLAATGGATLTVLAGLDAIASALGGQGAAAASLSRLTTLLIWQPWLESLAAYPRILLRRRLDLRYVAHVGLVSTTAFVLVAVGFLLWTREPLAVVWAQLLGTTITTGLLWQRAARLHAGHAGGWPKLRELATLAGESTRLFAGGAGGYLSERIDNLLVAGSLGPARMAYYSIAWNVTRIPVNVLAQAVSSVVAPSIAVGRDEARRVDQTLRSTFRFSVMILSIASATLFFVGPVLVEALLGSKWRPLEPILKVLAFTILNMPIHFVASAYLVTHGGAHLIGLASALQIAAQVAIIPVLCQRFGVVGAAYADVATNALVSAALCVAMALTARSVRWFDAKAALGFTLAAPLAAGLAVAVVPASQQSAVSAVAALVLSLGLFPLFGWLLGAADCIRDVAALVGRWLESSAGGPPLQG